MGSALTAIQRVLIFLDASGYYRGVDSDRVD